MDLTINICKYFVSKKTNTSNFHTLEVVARGSETQLQVGENLNHRQTDIYFIDRKKVNPDLFVIEIEICTCRYPWLCSH